MPARARCRTRFERGTTTAAALAAAAWLGLAPASELGAQGALPIQVDAAADRQPIDPRAYGVPAAADGGGPAFGDVSVRATGPDRDSLAVLAAQRSGDGALTVMTVNQAGIGILVRIGLSDFATTGPAEVWQLTPGAELERLHVASVGLQASASRTDTTTDIVDMNGDGIADVVTPGGVTLGAFTAATTGSGAGGFDSAGLPLRRRRCCGR